MMTRQNLRLIALLLSILMLLSSLLGCQPIIDLDDIPEYYGIAYVRINGNKPFFDEGEITDVAFESYSPLDPLGRCGVAFACIGIELMPTEERDDIGSVTPSGWEYLGVSNNNEYSFIDGGYLFNRCHLIGHQLAGEDANERNLITGTRYMNIEGMLPFENMVAEYVRESGNHVMYRVTPIFDGLDYLVRGVLMEGYSVEDNGRGICFCIYAYNVQPGVTIDYFTGINAVSGSPLPEVEDDGRGDDTDGDEDNPIDPPEEGDAIDRPEGVAITFVININTGKFHLPNSSCIDRINEENRKNYYGTKEELLAEEYEACKICNP